MANQTYYTRREAGVCVKCGSAFTNGSTRCFECTEADRTTYQNRRGNGECVKCGDFAVTGRTMCLNCLAKNADRVARFNEARAASGACVRCGDPLSRRSRRYCEKHLPYSQVNAGPQGLRAIEEAIPHYNGNCGCCLETVPHFLGVYSTPRYLETSIDFIRAAGWPQEGFLLLCANCAASLRRFGECAHERSS